MKQFLVLMGCFLISCTSNKPSKEKKVVQADQQTTLNSLESLAGCYTAVLKRDTSNLILEHLKGTNAVTGELAIKNFEKDSNTGNINGIVQEDLIIAWYNFMSENESSVRQIVFKVQGDTLYEGFGNIINKGDTDTIIFRNISDLKYLKEMPFIKRRCK